MVIRTEATRPPVLVGTPVTMTSTGKVFIKCSGCGCNFRLPNSHVTDSADCREARRDRIESQSDWDL